MRRKDKTVKLNEITIDVNANLTVDRLTAETCLKLLELYINQTDAMIVVDRLNDGSKRYRFEMKG